MFYKTIPVLRTYTDNGPVTCMRRMNYEKKIRNLIRATHNYILQKGIDCDVRFDIITIILSNNGEYELKHIKDAFIAGVNI